MKNTIHFVVSIILVFTFLFAGLPRAEACGPFILSPVFSLRSHADLPLKKFTSGNTGIVPETFSDMSLYVFFRQLNNLPLTELEQKQIVDAMEDRIYYRSGIYDNSGDDDGEKQPDYFAEWQAERAKVSDEKQDIETEKRLENSYDYFVNCLPDAFRNATRTLVDRIKAHGKTDANVADWLKGQDTVFSNCAGAAELPAAAGSDAPDWLKQDRQYQIGAAQFYQADLAAAGATFEGIANDRDSVWQNTARFVAARTLIRQASFATNPDAEEPDPLAEKTRDEYLKKASASLETILADASIKEFHGSAVRLLGLVKYRLMPSERRAELAGLLTNQAENRNMFHDLTDYTWLLEKIKSEAESVGQEIDQREAEAANQDYDYDYTLKLRDVPADKRSQELTDWILTFNSADGFAHAFEKWKETGKPHWFVAALSKAPADASDITELLTEAARIKPDSAGFATVRYHQIRILIESGKSAEARAVSDELLAADVNNLPLSTKNKFLSQRMILAKNLDEFLRYAQRKPVIFTYGDTYREEETSLADDEYLRDWEKRSMFDGDAVAFFNNKMPLAMLREAALSDQLPDHLKKFLVIAVWTRAFVLKNRTIEREFTPLVARYAREFTPHFSKYAEAGNVADREAAQLIAILRYPVIQPFVPAGFGREDSSPESIDSIRGNWWCADRPTEYNYSGNQNDYQLADPDFLTEEQKTAAARERQEMINEGNSSTLLGRRAVEFASSHVRHPRTPEILHLAVRSTRYGCHDENTGKFSKQAFDILHRRYRNSPWTKQTPYWFG